MKSDFGVYFLFWIPPVMPYGLCINNIERGIFHLLVSLISLCSWVCVYFHMLPNWFNHTYLTFFFASCSISSLLSIPSSLLHSQTNVFKDLCMHGPYFFAVVCIPSAKSQLWQRLICVHEYYSLDVVAVFLPTTKRTWLAENSRSLSPTLFVYSLFCRAHTRISNKQQY